MATPVASSMMSMTGALHQPVLSQSEEGLRVARNSIWRRQAFQASRPTAHTTQRQKTSSPLRVFATQAPARPQSSSVVRNDAGGPLDVVVVGAGVSGLCTAQALSTDHKNVISSLLVTEARDRAGGNITTVTDGTYLWEEGPNSFQPNVPMMKMSVR